MEITLFYVLNCFDDGDCSANQYCDKSGDWDDWDCVSDKSDGQSCTRDEQCSSGYCDNDGVGLSDDNHCFTPYNTYFDGQETSYCEVSTNYGISNCDERQSGTDLNKCVGISFYEDECSSTCQYQDITSVFECSESDCSCSQPLCDGLTTGSNISTCSAGGTYLADYCTSGAEGQDRGDNICRNSTFADGCTADAECNGVVAGTGDCNSTCGYAPDITPPNITEVITMNESGFIDGDILLGENITFNVTVTDEGSSVENVWLKIWEGTIGISNTIWQGFLSLVVGDLWSVEIETNETFPVGEVNYTVYANDSVGNEVNVSGNFTTVLPDDPHKYYHKNSLGEVVAWLGNQGNIVLKGNCYSGGSCDNPGDGSLIFRNESDYNLGFINITGDLCIIKGDCSDQSANCNSPVDGAFIMANSTDYTSYIDGEGDLCLVGGLYENANL